MQLFDEGQVHLQELVGVAQIFPGSHRVYIILHLRTSAHALCDDLAALCGGHMSDAMSLPWLL